MAGRPLSPGAGGRGGPHAGPHSAAPAPGDSPSPPPPGSRHQPRALLLPQRLRPATPADLVSSLNAPGSGPEDPGAQRDLGWRAPEATRQDTAQSGRTAQNPSRAHPLPQVTFLHAANCKNTTQNKKPHLHPGWEDPWFHRGARYPGPNVLTSEEPQVPPRPASATPSLTSPQ